MAYADTKYIVFLQQLLCNHEYKNLVSKTFLTHTWYALKRRIHIPQQIFTITLYSLASASANFLVRLYSEAHNEVYLFSAYIDRWIR